MPNFAPYGAARQALLQAQARVAETPADEQALAAMAAAHERLREEEQPILVELGLAWDGNVTAIADANMAFTEARQALTALEIQIGVAARTRDPIRPVVNADELAALETANLVVEDARAALVETQQSFKAGVTVEQLEAVT
jgi:hypothetical protein